MKNNKFHFIGIGGVGMSGIALILSGLGAKVSGSDLEEGDSVRMLRSAGIDVFVGSHCEKNVTCDIDLVIFSSAVAGSNPEMIAAINLGIRCVRRGEFLAELAQQFDFSIAVSGSHGKTTTTAMIAHILQVCGFEPAYMVGGAVAGWDRSASIGKGRVLVTEIDESDGTQSFFKADCAVILNIEDDHSWSAGGQEKLFDSFRKVAKQSTDVFAWPGELPDKLLSNLQHVNFLQETDIPKNLEVPQPGKYNLMNGFAAVKAAVCAGVDFNDAVEALLTFPGVKRRMTILLTDDVRKLVLLEDYAHHPTEVRAVLSAIREKWPTRRLEVIFQPHRYERVKRYGAQFSRELSVADSVIVASPFAAWCSDSDLADPSKISSEITGAKSVYINVKGNDFSDVVTLTDEMFAKSDAVIAVLGAGSITKICPKLLELYGNES